MKGNTIVCPYHEWAFDADGVIVMTIMTGFMIRIMIRVMTRGTIRVMHVKFGSR